MKKILVLLALSVMCSIPAFAEDLKPIPQEKYAQLSIACTNELYGLDKVLEMDFVKVPRDKICPAIERIYALESSKCEAFLKMKDEASFLGQESPLKMYSTLHQTCTQEKLEKSGS